MPPLPRFDRILKSVLKQFKKIKKYKTFALHSNLCPSNHTNQQTWNNANLLKKSSQNELSSINALTPHTHPHMHRHKHKKKTHTNPNTDTLTHEDTHMHEK